MATLASMPGGWPRDFTPEPHNDASLSTAESTLHGRISARKSRSIPFLLQAAPRTPLPNSMGFGIREEPPKSHILSPVSPLAPDELFLPCPISFNRERTRPQARRASRQVFLSPLDELFFPGFGSPSAETPNTANSPPATLPDNTVIPRLTLRVNTVSLQNMIQTVSPVDTSAGSLNENRFFAGNFPTAEAQVWSQQSTSSQRCGSSSHRMATPGIGVQDELFLFSPGPSQNPGPSTNPVFPGPGSTLRPSSGVERSYFTLYEPPAELQSLQNGTSVEVESLLLPSILRVRAREEESRRLAAARLAIRRGELLEVKPLRTKSTTVAAQIDPLTISSAFQETTGIQERERWPYVLNATPESPTSYQQSTSGSVHGAMLMSPNDSGYGSASPGLETSSPTSESKRSFPGFKSLFKRKRKEKWNSQESLSPVSDGQNSTSSTKTTPLSPLPSLGYPSRQVPVKTPHVVLAQEPPSRTTDCVSCLDDFPTPELIKLECHSYCVGCFLRFIANALETEAQWPVKCCLNEIPSYKILPHLDNQTIIKFQQREAEWSIPPGERIYCAAQTCSAWIPPSNVKHNLRIADCPVCKHQTCTICRGDFHANNDCPQDTGLQATIGLAEIEGWKRCYKCSAFVEHNQGCMHMTCRCKAQFCYLCGLKWRTCGCKDVELPAFLLAAANRRRQMNARHTAEQAAAAREAEQRARAAAREADIAAENLQILEEVETFIRQEAEREAKTAEAERRRVERERRSREENHVERVHQRFLTLNNELEVLHNVQQLLMSERHDHQTSVLAQDLENRLSALSVRHAAEEQALIASTKTKMAAAEAKFEAELQRRAVLEREGEAEYVSQLEAFWIGKPGGEYQIRVSRDKLRSERGPEKRRWEGQERARLWALGDSETRKLPLLRKRQRSEVKSANEAARVGVLEWKKKKEAELRWRGEVFPEQVAMLQALEVEEYASEVP